MSKLWFSIVPVLVGCGVLDSGDGLAYTVSITSDVPFRRIEFSGVLVDAPSATILTPELLATGDRPTDARSLSLTPVKTITFDDDTTESSWDTWTLLGPGFSQAFARAFDGSNHVVGASQLTAFSGDSNLTMTLAISSQNPVEVWGTGACMRLTLDKTYFVSSSDDRDCDGLVHDGDRNPNAWCSPNPTTDAERAACRAPTDPSPGPGSL